tara:strand:- start:3426 stop:3974 length:549 start_codon:yes stop_codon:yes gene_type:complete
MLHPSCKEWDDYFTMCEDGTSPEERLSKLHQCRIGIRDSPVSEFEELRTFLKNNQLCRMIDIMDGTTMGYERVKDVLFHNRDVFFMFKANAKGDQTVRYSTLDERPWDELKGRSKATLMAKTKGNRIQMVHWMRIMGFIDPYFFHLPIGITEKGLCSILDDMRYPRRLVDFGDKKRYVYFVG